MRKVQEIRENKYTLAVMKSSSGDVCPKRLDPHEHAQIKKPRIRRSVFILYGFIICIICIAGFFAFKAYASKDNDKKQVAKSARQIPKKSTAKKKKAPPKKVLINKKVSK